MAIACAIDAEPVSSAPPAAPSPADLRQLRWLLWLYCAVWLLEGALRKWFLPFLANPLLIARDPLLLLIYGLAFAKGIFPRHPFVYATAALGALTFLISAAATQTPWLVLVFGARCDFLFLPLVFVIPKIFNRADIVDLGRFTLWTAPFMAALVLLQFEASDKSILNTATGGEGAQMDAAFGHVRPSGTFSFTNGLTCYTFLLTAFFLCQLLEKNKFPRLLWLAAAPSLAILVVLSGSRMAAGGVALIIGMVVAICFVKPRYLGASLKLAGALALVVAIVMSFSVFRKGLDVFAYRFGSTENVKTGFVGRFFATFTSSTDVLSDTSIVGNGLGMGTNVAAGLMLGKRAFMEAEGEYARAFLESGPVLGGAYLALRFGLMLLLGFAALKALRGDGSTLPALLFAAAANNLVQGQWAQPTELGFGTLAAGLCLAAIVPGKTADAPIAPPAKRAAPPPTARGRSQYAEQLHGAAK